MTSGTKQTRAHPRTSSVVAVTWDRMHNSFWFLPAVFVLMAVVLHVIGMLLDDSGDWTFGRWVIFSGGAEAARTLLSTLATSTITVTGVLFSITIVVLTLASSQLGPRLLRNFMGDAPTQYVFGIFVGSFIYHILVLRMVSVDHGVPDISVTLSVLLAVIDSGFLILYIHHISVSVQADQMIDGVIRPLHKMILESGKSKDSSPCPAETVSARSLFKDVNADSIRAVTTAQGGYLQTVDIERLVCLADDISCLFQLRCKAGDYKLPGAELVLVRAEMPLCEGFYESVRECFVLGKVRTPVQDIEFAVEQIVEIALRALSPSLNDPFTAVTCIDKLSSVVCLFLHHEPSGYVCGRKGRVRLIIDRVTLGGLLELCFNLIRQSGYSHPSVVIRLLERMRDVIAATRSQEQREIVRRYAGVIQEHSAMAKLAAWDRKAIEARYSAVLEVSNQGKAELLSNAS